MILDVVVNHTADVDPLPAAATYSTRRTATAAARTFNPAALRRRHDVPVPEARRTMPRVAVRLPAAERNAKKPAWLNDPPNYHNRGDIDFNSCSQTCFEQGDFFGLDDLFTEQPAVVNGLATVYAGLDRALQARRLPDRHRAPRRTRRSSASGCRRSCAAARAAGVPDFQLFGEVVRSTTRSSCPTFVRDRGLPNVLDFPFQDAAAGFAAGSASARGSCTRLDDDDYFRRRAAIAPTPPTFLGNHDMGRAAYQIRSRRGGG